MQSCAAHAAGVGSATFRFAGGDPSTRVSDAASSSGDASRNHSTPLRGSSYRGEALSSRQRQEQLGGRGRQIGNSRRLQLSRKAAVQAILRVDRDASDREDGNEKGAQRMRSSFSLQASSSMALPTLETPRSRSSSPVRRKTAQEKVDDAVRKQAALMADMKIPAGIEIDDELLGTAYERSGEVCAEYAKTFYLGEFFLTGTSTRQPSATAYFATLPALSADACFCLTCRTVSSFLNGAHSHVTFCHFCRFEFLCRSRIIR